MRHHYIPIFYLRQWAGDDGKICQFSRRHIGVVAKRKHPSGAGYQDDLYALDGVSEDLRHWLERVFLLVSDQLANDAMHQLLAGNGNMGEKLRSGWSRFIMSLFSRTPDRIDYLRALLKDELASRMEKLSNAYDEFHANDEVPPSPEQKAAEIHEQSEIAAGQLIQNVMDLPDVGRHINNMEWAVLNIPKLGQRTLLTSDKPVLLSHGLQHQDAYFALPIGPNKLFIAANHPSSIEAIQNVLPSDAIRASNAFVAKSAIEYVYGTDDYQKNFVEKYLRVS